jgi:transposase-like protein
MRGQRHGEELKQRAVADLMGGDSIAVVSERYELPEGTVKAWSAQRGQVDLVQPQKKEELGELVADLLATNLRGLRTIAGLPEDREWLKKQTASELAIFYGVLADKSIRILGALRPAGDGNGERASEDTA